MGISLMITEDVSPKELLLARGWRKFHECWCSGIHRMEFDNKLGAPGYEIVCYFNGSNGGKFKLIRWSKLVVKAPFSQLEEELDKL